jgi:hypothetical protein
VSASKLDILPSVAPMLSGALAPVRGAFWPSLPLRSPYDVGRLVPGRFYGLSVSGGVIELPTSFMGESSPPPGGGLRGPITEFSKASRARLFKRCASLDWDSLGCGYFVTLTYPSEFPCDGVTVKRDLRNLRDALSRRFPGFCGLWKFEFQRRGAPHIHLALFPGTSDLQLFRTFLADSWYRIVGSGDPAHLLAGTQCDFLRSKNPATYFAGYMTKSGVSKEYQNQVPEGFMSVGRFWGTWNLPITVRSASLAAHESVDIARVLRALVRSKGRRVRSRGRCQSVWYYLPNVDLPALVDQLSRLIGRPLLLC